VPPNIVQDFLMRFCPKHRAMVGRLAVVAALTSSLAVDARAQNTAAATQPRPLPTRLTDAEFWKLVTDASEPGGAFPSDNFTSNEMGFPRIMQQLRASSTTGGAYLGVGPEQNFSYMVAIRPQIAFLVDIRRQSVIQHLMYKAIFELSKDRGDFVSLLFSKPRPAGIDSATSIYEVWERYWTVTTDTTAFDRNLARISDHLTRTHGFTLDVLDRASLRYVYQAFYALGPKIQYAGYGAPERPAGNALNFVDGRVVGVSLPPRPPVIDNTTGITMGNGTVINGNGDVQIRAILSPFSMTLLSGPGLVTSYYGGVNFAALTMATDDDGYPRGFLSSEDNYRFVKDLHTRNMFIPVVGDFAGPKAIRTVGQYLRDHGTTLTAFYTSNVESYLFQNNVWQAFYRNVETLPVTPRSVFIRGGTSLCPIGAFLAAFNAGRVTTCPDATGCMR
jgi:hypothetical protein